MKNYGINSTYILLKGHYINLELESIIDKNCYYMINCYSKASEDLCSNGNENTNVYNSWKDYKINLIYYLESCQTINKIKISINKILKIYIFNLNKI